MTLADTEVFYTDKQLCERYRCTTMTLWRWRQKGKLKAIKIGGGRNARNLTPISEVKAVEAVE